MGKSNGITRILALRGKKGAIKPKSLAVVVAAAALTSAPALRRPLYLHLQRRIRHSDNDQADPG
jgi:hypothetical protein